MSNLEPRDLPTDISMMPTLASLPAREPKYFVPDFSEFNEEPAPSVPLCDLEHPEACDACQ